MELFSLLAKLTLDKKEFDSAINEAENEARGITVENPELGLDKDDFDTGIDEANDAEVENPDNPELGLDKTEFDQNIDEAEEKGETFAGSLGSIFKELKGVLITSGIVAAVGAVVSSLKEGVELAKNHGDQIDKQSQKMGISAKAYQEWAYALNLSGASIDDLNRGLRTWQQSIGDEDATAKLSKAFSDLGMDAGEAIKQLEKGENLDNVLDQVLFSLADYEGSDRGAIVEALFGRNATALNALLNSTADDIRDMKQEADDLGMVMTDEEVKNAAAYMDATTRMEGAIQGLKEALVKDLLPYLTDAANTIAKIVAFFNPRTKEQSLSDMFADKDGAFAEELVTIEGTAAAAESLADKLLAMGNTSKMTAEQYAIWEGTAKNLIELVPSLGEVINLETGEITANSEEIKENIRQWENLAKQKALQTLKEEKYQAIVQKNQDLIDKSVEANKKAAEAEKAKIEAAGKFSQKMQEYGLGSLDMNGDIDQQISDVMDKLAENGDQYESELLGLGVALKEYGEAGTAAGKAQAEVDRLTEELQKGEEEYQNWLKTAEEMYGIQFEETTKARNEIINYIQELKNVPSDVYTTIHQTYQVEGYTHAIGANYIPYDNYPALLHRGERVLTATEARKGTGDGIDYTRLEDSIVASIRAGMADAQVTAVVTDSQVAKGANRYNGTEIDSRRFMP